jgi:hypothetical protein
MKQYIRQSDDIFCDLVYTGGQLYTHHGRRGPLNISMQNRHHVFLQIDKYTISGDLVHTGG